MFIGHSVHPRFVMIQHSGVSQGLGVYSLSNLLPKDLSGSSG